MVVPVLVAFGILSWTDFDLETLKPCREKPLEIGFSRRCFFLYSQSAVKHCYLVIPAIMALGSVVLCYINSAQSKPYTLDQVETDN